MGLLKFKKRPQEPQETEEQRTNREWAESHPYGEEGSPEYWVEAFKRAYEISNDPRALEEIAKLQTLTGPQAPVSAYHANFPEWFFHLWYDNIAPYNRYTHKIAMPY